MFFIRLQQGRGSLGRHGQPANLPFIGESSFDVDPGEGAGVRPSIEAVSSARLLAISASASASTLHRLPSLNQGHRWFSIRDCRLSFPSR
jgi:hypothetical protein